MKQRDSFVFYRSFRDALSDLPSDGRARLFMAIADYSLDGIEPSLDGIGLTIWKLIRPNLNASRTRFENGCKGGAPIGNTNAKKTYPNNRNSTEIQPNINQETSNKDMDKDEEGDKDKDKEEKEDMDNGVSFDTSQPITPIIEFEEVKPTNPKRTKFTPPSLLDVLVYTNENDLETDGEAFFYFYESNGWRVGRNPMKDWKMALKRWAREDAKKRNQQKQYGNATTDSRREQRDAELAAYINSKIEQPRPS